MKNLLKITILVMLLFAAYIGNSQQLAFPSAEGSGRFATGGRSGTVYEVTNLSNSGKGSIVDAVSMGNRTIVFRVSGNIELGDVILKPKSNTTIAGQTAPGDGICIKGRIQIDASNIIIRYLRVRVDAGAKNSSGDAVDISSGTNIIIDHVSGSYARDEGISCQETSNKITVQWCIISEALSFESHSYGSLVRGDFGDEKTYHHNLYAHNNARNPRPGNYTDISKDPEGLHFDFRNNVVYNWAGSKPGYNADVTTVSRYNFIGNVFIPGSESSGNIIFRESSYVSYAYFADNMYNGVVPDNQWSIVDLSGFSISQTFAYKNRSYIVPMEPVTTTSPEEAQADVLAKAGACFPVRDIIDTRIVNDVKNNTGHSIKTTDDQPEGAWPELYSLPAPADSDHDGMPDDWEDANSLNKNDSSDRNTVASSGYTMLEVYLNSLVDLDNAKFNNPVADIQFTRSDNSNLKITWFDNYFSEDGFIIEKSIDGINFVFIDSLANNSTEYIDVDQVVSPSLRYRVIAFKGDKATPYPTEYIENNSIDVKSTTNIFVGDTIQMKLYLLPEDSHNRAVDWSVKEEDLSKVVINNDGQLIAFESGVVDVNVETSDGLGINKTITFTISNSTTSSIQKLNVESDLIQVFPNPFGNKLSVCMKEEISADAEVRIYNGVGNIVKQFIPGSMKFELETGLFEKGIYLISIQNNGKILNKMIMKD